MYGMVSSRCRLLLRNIFKVVSKIMLAISAPKHHIFQMAPFLIFRCPTTNQQCECDVATDAANLAKVWKMTKDIKCRICGEMHKIKIRDAFLDMVMAREIVIAR